MVALPPANGIGAPGTIGSLAGIDEDQPAVCARQMHDFAGFVDPAGQELYRRNANAAWNLPFRAV
jgi:hypothetical protein